MVTGMGRYFIPMNIEGIKNSRHAYYYFMNMQKVMADTW